MIETSRCLDSTHSHLPCDFRLIMLNAIFVTSFDGVRHGLHHAHFPSYSVSITLSYKLIYESVLVTLLSQFGITGAIISM